MKKLIALVLMITVLVSFSGCGKKEEKVRHIKSYKSTSYYGDESVSTELVYNEKGLATEMKGSGDKISVTYNFDKYDNPTKVVAQRGKEGFTITLENEYDGDKLKKVIITSLEYDDEVFDLSKEPAEWRDEPAMYVSVFLPFISNFENYSDVDIECPGTGSVIRRSDKDNIFTRTVQMKYYSEVTNVKNEDGTMITTSISGSIKDNKYVPGNSTKTTYDKDNKITEIELSMYDSEASITLYFEYKRHDDGDGYYEESYIRDYKISADANTEETIESGLDSFKNIFYYDKNDVITKQEKTMDFTKDIVYYNEDGFEQKMERYNGDTLSSVNEYEYWD